MVNMFRATTTMFWKREFLRHNKERKVILRLKYSEVDTVEPGYNDIGLYDISSIASDILWDQLTPHC
jgi:hypothetical protein